MDKVNRYIALPQGRQQGSRAQGHSRITCHGLTHGTRWSRSIPTARTTSVSLSRSRTGASWSRLGSR